MSRNKRSCDKLAPNSCQIFFVTAPNEAAHVEVRPEGETFWPTHKQIADLFCV